MRDAQRRRSLAGAVLAASVAWSAVAEAQVGFAWSRGEGAAACPSGEEMRQRVAARLGRDPFAGEGGGRILNGIVSREGSRLVARVFLLEPDGKPHGQREIVDEAADCGALADATSLAIALVIDPDAPFLSTTVPRPPPAPAAPASQPAAAGAAQRPAGAASEGTDTQLAASVRLEGSLGLVPHAALGLDVGARVALVRRLTVAFGMGWIPAASAQRDEFDVALTAARAGVCFEPARGAAITLLGCAQGNFGALSASPGEQTVTPQGEHAWVALEADALLAIRPGVGGSRWLIELGVGGFAPLVRTVFVGREVGFEQPPVAGKVFAGLGAHFL